MKKKLALIIVLALMITSLIGCSSSGTDETAGSAETAVEESAAQETETGEETDGADVSETGEEVPGGDTVLRVGGLSGPTTMGLVHLMDLSDRGESEGNYEFTMVTDAAELVAMMVSGDMDIVLVPANMASILYQRTEGNVKVIDINTLGVLYIVTADESIKEITDLEGKTIYMTGKGTTPDYALQYLLSAYGLSADDVNIEYKSEATEVAAVLAEDPYAIGLLPQPFVTSAIAQNDALMMVMDLTEEWDKTQGEDGSSLVTGVTVAAGDLFDDPETAAAVDIFMAEHKDSSEFANSNVEETAQLVADAGIVAQAAVAEKAIPYCSITYIDGEEMKTKLSGYLLTLYDQDPSSVGGEMPGDDFYYKG